jgi:hypothetical protein
MYPHERSLVEEMKGKPFALIGVNSDSVEDAKAAIEENGLNWRSFQNSPEGREKPHSADWLVSGWPTVVVLDANFKIRYRGHDGNEATRIAEELVAEMKPIGN